MKGSILLVEDETCLARLMALELSEAGYEVTIAKDGLLGLEQAQTTAPDLLLLDWSLPKLTGLDICAKLRIAGHAVPIIFVTSRAEDEYKAIALEAGANDYLMKPFNINSLLEKISAFFAPAAVSLELNNSAT